MSEAAALGDRSENAEYIYGKKRLREIDRRVRYLDKRLEDITVVSTKPDNPDKVFFGAWVNLEKENGDTVEYRIVGGDEIDSDSSRGYISVDSPMARALLKKSIDDEVVVNIAGVQHTYWVIGIRYQ